MSVEIIIGDMREKLRALEADSLDSCVTDPPYHLTNNTGTRSPYPGQYTPIGKPKQPRGGFMGQQWDGGDVAFQPATWAEVFRVLKPGAHLVAFSGTRTYHRMVCAIEDAGFEIRDQLAWIYGSGFPKSHDVSKQLDKQAGTEREIVVQRTLNNNRFAISGSGQAQEQFRKFEGNANITAPATEAAREWEGWGTALKPAWEPIVLARKPLIGTVAANVLQHGTGALNIDGCRIETGENLNGGRYSDNKIGGDGNTYGSGINERSASDYSQPLGRWPANIIHDGSEEVLAGFPVEAGGAPGRRINRASIGYGGSETEFASEGFADTGSAARFFYCAKADAGERHIGGENRHPTVKPLDLMRWLITLVTPKGGTILDPFMGSGSTLVAADRAQFNAIGIELSPQYAEIARNRLSGDRGGLLDAMEAA